MKVAPPSGTGPCLRTASLMSSVRRPSARAPLPLMRCWVRMLFWETLGPAGPEPAGFSGLCATKKRGRKVGGKSEEEKRVRRGRERECAERKRALPEQKLPLRQLIRPLKWSLSKNPYPARPPPPPHTLACLLAAAFLSIAALFFSPPGSSLNMGSACGVMITGAARLAA